MAFTLNKIIYTLILLNCFTLFGQNVDSNFIIGITNSNAYIGSKFSFGCIMQIDEILKKPTPVLLYGYYKCSSQINDQYYKTIYNGIHCYLHTQDVTISPENEVKLKEMDSITSANLQKEVEKYSEIIQIKKQESLKSELDELLLKANKNELLIRSIIIYDQSEYTEGTGFKISIENLSKKNIKYIWITISGINPVNDVVSKKTVQCVGPINSKNIAEYSFDYVWFTDIITSYKLPIIKIQYMDGTIKSIQNADKLIIPEECKSIFNTMNEY